MEEDREPKHVCKYCSKSFRCDRSLGGHMRSHAINNSAKKDEKLEFKKLSSVNNGYRLRENPKKTWRVAAISVEVLLQDKSCKECGKGFHSWKALFGHMKCHSEKQRVANNLEEHQDSWTDENTNQKLVMDRQSDNDLSTPNRRKRSERRTRCVTTATSAFSLIDPASSVSDSKHEQEEVALSLMMLSRDVGSWGALNSVTESSENDSMYSQAQPNLVNQIEDRAATSDLRKPTEQGEKGKLRISDFVEKEQGHYSETLTSEFSRTISKMKRTRVSVNEFLDRLKNSHCDDQYQPQETQHKLGNKSIKEIQLAKIRSSCKGYTSIKRKFSDLYDCKVRKSNPLKQVATKVSGAELCSNSHLGSKFECTTCNKVFSSYQALGGHRASHRRTVACSVIESSEKSTETDLSPEETDYNTIIESDKKEYQEHTSVRRVRKNKGHECSICFKVFTSGQALGGHKRSHLIAYTDSRNSETLTIQKPVSEMRDFLDLNLPASAEEESNNQVSSYSPPWRLSTGHKREEIAEVVSSSIS